MYDTVCVCVTLCVLEGYAGMCVHIVCVGEGASMCMCVCLCVHACIWACVCMLTNSDNIDKIIVSTFKKFFYIYYVPTTLIVKAKKKFLSQS